MVIERRVIGCIGLLADVVDLEIPPQGKGQEKVAEVDQSVAQLHKSNATQSAAQFRLDDIKSMLNWFIILLFVIVSFS